MKNNYLAPTIEIVEIKDEVELLVYSNTFGDFDPAGLLGTDDL